MVYIYGQMENHTMVSGSRVKNMALVFGEDQREIVTWVSGRKDAQMVLVFMYG